MSSLPKPDPTKSCEWCGAYFTRKRFDNGRLEDRGVFLRRKFCSLSCSTLYRHNKPSPNIEASRKRAHRAAAQSCEICGSSSNSTVHHIDENPMNNALSNLQPLCINCHSFWHAVAKRAGVTKPGRFPPLFLSVVKSRLESLY